MSPTANVDQLLSESYTIHCIPVRITPRHETPQVAHKKKRQLVRVPPHSGFSKGTHVKLGYINCRSARNKTASILNFIIENDLDLLAMVETWFSAEGDEANLQELTPEGYLYKHAPRPTPADHSNGGGIALVYHSNFQI